ncbi:LytR/AlgR family response regulator transcription factor [Formosa sp. S-31]|uniref:LytR/AlgR family response regulator transcription factor n=1 Tax=Formosa sp. S-31 TaxID=2790949 RepID=UPI003EBDE2EB
MIKITTCIIVEDQPPAQRLLQKYIADLGTLKLLGTFSDALEAMQFLQENHVELIFLDIHLPKLSGLNFLKTLETKPNVILTTAFSEYALESYEYSVVDYLLKPFSFERFVKAVLKVPKKEGSKTAQVPIGEPDVNRKKGEVFIKSGHEHVRLEIDSIFYIKSDADYTELYLEKTKYLTYDSLRYWADTLKPHSFIRVHKSYVVNLSKIKKISGNLIVLSNDAKIPLGRSYKDDFMDEVLN